MRNIGLTLSLLRHGGGTYQWTMNILHALEDYRKTHGGVRVNIFYSTQRQEHKRVQEEFPDFCYHQIGRAEIFWSKVLTGVFICAPFLIKFLRCIFPLNLITARKSIDLMIFPGASFYPSFYNRKQIFMFGDIAHVFYPHFPEISSNGELRKRNLLFKYGISQAGRIVVDSNQLRDDVAKYYQTDISKVDVLYQTMSQTVKSLDTYDEECANFVNKLPKKYLFYPAQLWEHKNHRNLLLAMKILMRENSDLFLVLTGSKKEGSERIFTFMEELGIQSNVRYLGYLKDKFIPLLYRNAQMLVMPTYFGPTNIPTLEAFYFGCPAVISNLPGVREQTQDAALLFDPTSAQDIADKIALLLYDHGLRKEMIKKGYERMKCLAYENYRNKLFTVLDKNLN